MPPDRHLVVFAKAPRIGRVKSRLARDVGRVAAWQFYRTTLDDLLRRLADDRRWRCWLAIAPDTAVADPALRRCDWRVMPQGRGDLGARMSRVVRRLPPGPVVIVGSDIPEVQAGHISRAFRALGAADAVFGPAPDGGYWLVGLRRRPRCRLPFGGVRWSTPHALADTVAALGDARVACLDVLEDVDDGAGLARWQARRRRDRA